MASTEVDREREEPDGIPGDDELLVRLRSGDASAFDRVVDRWERDLIRFVRLLGARENEAEDMVQETFLKLWKSRHRYRDLTGGTFRPLLLRIARNVWVDNVRRSLRRVSTVPIDGADESATGVAEPVAHEPGARLDLLDALDRLGEKHRMIVVLAVFEGLDYRTVGEILEIPLGTVKSRMHNALLKLREMLDGDD